jgi:subtilisin family serine protease
MDFPWGSSYLPVYLGAGSGSVLLSWDQFDRCGDTDLDAWVYDEDGAVVGRSEERQSVDADSCSPIERIRVTTARTDWYYLRVLHYAGDPNVRLSVFARDGTAYQATPGSLADPASSPSSFSVGAVRAAGYLDNGLEGFSSRGPSHAGAAKPDIAGPDGLSTAVYGQTGFYGTSASTPAVAAAIVLLLQEDPSLTPHDAAARLQANAISGRATWQAPDGDEGAGYARLFAPDADGRMGGCGGGGAWVFVPSLLWCGSMRGRLPRRCS